MTPKAPSYDFFHEKLVTQCTKVIRAARKAGVKRVSIMNSYFAFFDRQPLYNGRLSKNHPYIKVRREQAEACINEGAKGVMDVMILELPYIFGSMPGRMPLWKEVFLDRFDMMPAVLFPKGGTVMIHVRGIAQSVVASVLNGEHGNKYPIGESNMKYKQMIKIMYDAIGNKKKIITTPTWMAYLGGVFVNKAEKKHGKEGGLNYAKLMTDIQSKDLYYSDELIARVKEQLDYAGLGFTEKLDVVKGIQETMQACYPEKFPDSDPANQVKEDLEIIDKVWKELNAKEEKKQVAKDKDTSNTDEKAKKTPENKKETLKDKPVKATTEKTQKAAQDKK